MTLDVFIISWFGQHQNAASIARQLEAFQGSVHVVYSDPDPDFRPDVACSTIRRPNELYWGDKFRACLDTLKSDLLLVIQADCKCDDWVQLVNRCLECYRHNPDVGIWAPRVIGTPFDVELTRIKRIDGSSTSIVAQTDGICFALSPSIISRMKSVSYESNVFGWGIGWMMVSVAYCHNKLVMVDESIVVKHPVRSGYPHREAYEQQAVFLQQLTLQEQAQLQLLEDHIRLQTMRRNPAFKAVRIGARLWSSLRSKLATGG